MNISPGGHQDFGVALGWGRNKETIKTLQDEVESLKHKLANYKQAYNEVQDETDHQIAFYEEQSRNIVGTTIKTMLAHACQHQLQLIVTEKFEEIMSNAVVTNLSQQHAHLFDRNKQLQRQVERLERRLNFPQDVRSLQVHVESQRDEINKLNEQIEHLQEELQALQSEAQDKLSSLRR